MKSPMKEHLKASNHEGDELSDPCQHRRLIGKLLYVTLTKLDNSFSANDSESLWESQDSLIYKMHT